MALIGNDRLHAITVMRRSAEMARARVGRMPVSERRHLLETAEELEGAANALEAGMCRGERNTARPMDIGQAIAVIDVACDRIGAATGLGPAEGRELAAALKRALFLIAEMKREQAAALVAPANGAVVTVDQWDYRAMAWLNLDGPTQVQHLEAGRDLVREARSLIWAGPRPYENAATYVIVRKFLGFLSGDVPELRSVPVTLLADAWERFKAICAEEKRR